MKYFALQCKRVVRLLPSVLIITALLGASLSILLVNWATKETEENKKKFGLGIVGTVDSTFYSWGLAAIQNIDSSRYAVDIRQMTEEEAKKGLIRGDLKAYVVIPEDFIRQARMGNIKTIHYYTTVGSKGVGSILKDEFTRVIARVLNESQKGAYGLYDILYDYKDRQSAETESDALSFEYVDIILNRSSLYDVKEAGVYDGLTFFEYLLSGFMILAFCVFLLPFASLYVKSDLSFQKVFASAGQKPAGQILAEYGALYAVMFLLAMALTLLIEAGPGIFGSSLQVQIDFNAVGFALCMIPAVALITAFAFMMYEFSGNLISGVVTYFFFFVFLCYISGCAYPVYMLPDIMQKTAKFLPMGAARELVASGMMGKADLSSLLTVLGMTALCLAISFVTRCRKLSGKGE